MSAIDGPEIWISDFGPEHDRVLALIAIMGLMGSAPPADEAEEFRRDEPPFGPAPDLPDCLCGHSNADHAHQFGGNHCSLCDCAMFRPAWPAQLN